MKTLLSVFFLVSVYFNLYTQDGLNVGDNVPDFQAVDDGGKTWKLSDHLRSDYIVVYFYPAAFTGGCTQQACNYRDHQTELSILNAIVVGVSGDAPENLIMFKKEHNLKFTLLSDGSGELAKLFGVPVKDGGTIEKEVNGQTLQLARGVTTSRWTFIIDSRGKLIYRDSKVNASSDGEEVLKFIQTHNSRKTCR